jgi:large subunit ribosomal protein L22
MEITVKKMYLKRSPRKVRPVLFNIKKKNATQALAILKFTDKAVSKELYTLLVSGVAAFKDQDLDTEKVYIKNVKCDDGPRLKRRRMVSKGQATAIQKRMCHLTMTLSDGDELKEEDKKAEKKTVETKAVEKTEAKVIEKKTVAKKPVAKKTIKEDKGSKE